MLLGGQRVSDVVEVNTQEGWAVRHVLQDGKPVYDPVAKALVKERVQGNYTLTWRMEE